MMHVGTGCALLGGMQETWASLTIIDTAVAGVQGNTTLNTAMKPRGYTQTTN
jgi:hypothetical protein